MKRIAILAPTGVVKNIEAHPDNFSPNGTTQKDVTSLRVGPGWSWDGEDWAEPPLIPPAVTRARFDDIFAHAIGEVIYDDVLDTLAAIAATEPKTDESVKVKRALRALDQTQRIEFPLGEWSAPAAHDLTGSFLKVVHDVLVGGDAQIGDKIDAGLQAWRSMAARL